MVALSPAETELHGLSSGTTETMGVLQFCRACNVKTNSYATMAMDSIAGESCGISSRSGSSHPEFQLNYVRCGRTVGSGALQDLLHLDNYYMRLENGLDLAEDERYDLGQLDHWGRQGFSLSVSSEGPLRSPHRFGMTYIYGFYMHPMFDARYAIMGVDYPEGSRCTTSRATARPISRTTPKTARAT